MRKRYAAAVTALLVLAMTGCETTNTGAGALIGGLAGGVVGDVAGRHLGRGGRLATTAAFSAGGALVGASIGSMLDTRDRERAQAATLAALRRPLPPSYYQQPAVYTPPPVPDSSPPVTRSRPAAAPVARSQQPATVAPSVTQAPVAAPPAPAPSTTNLPNLPVAPDRWVSDHSGATGSTEVLSARPPANGRGECRTVKQLAAWSGQQKSDTETYCETAPRADDWQKI